MLDCCDISVLKVEEVDVAAVPGIEKFTRSPKLRIRLYMNSWLCLQIVGGSS